MSNFYYCNDCKKDVDLIVLKNDGNMLGHRHQDLACKECGGTNWKAMIDSSGGEPKESKADKVITTYNFIGGMFR